MGEIEFDRAAAFSGALRVKVPLASIVFRCRWTCRVCWGSVRSLGRSTPLGPGGKRGKMDRRNFVKLGCAVAAGAGVSRLLTAQTQQMPPMQPTQVSGPPDATPA